MADASPNLVYACKQWEIDLGRRELRSGGTPVPLGSRAFQIVEVMVQSARELVTKDQLMERVWPGAIVGEGTLHVHISAVRKALGADRGLLKTASGRGYRLLGSWAPQQQEAPAAPVPSPPTRATGTPPANNFPPLITRLIGRSEAAQFVRDLVSAYRVVTLTGPGGIGKTSLAVKAVRYLLPDFEDGGWIVELASLSDPDLLPSTVAGVLGLKLGGGEISAEAVARAVGTKHLLLVLDNCEHLIEAAANLAETVMRLCPHITIVATSQETLRIDGEIVYRVPSLDVPAPEQEAPDHILAHSAVELFIARTKSLDDGFSPRREDLVSIGAICRRLDGIPLALEFAAARAAWLGIRQVAMGLHDRFALLTAGRRTALPRHRTLRAALDWSHELLPEAERRLLRRLAIFPAGFTADAAAAVMKDTGLDAAAVTDGIANLVAKSLVTLDKADPGSRWYLLETIRAYALDKLVEHGEVETAARHHAEYFRDLFAQAGTRSRLLNDDLPRRRREIDNVRAALDWSFSSTGEDALGIDLTVAYTPVWLHLSLIGECRARCERALLACEPDRTSSIGQQMELQIALGIALFVTLGPPEQAEAVLTEALENADVLNDLDAQARALAALSTAYVYRGKNAQAQATLERLRHVAHQIGDPAIIAVADRRMGTRLLTSGRLGEAREYLERVLQSPARPEDQRVPFWNYLDARAMARAMLARALCLQGFAEKAHNEAKTSLDELLAADHPLSICRVLNFGICRIATMTGDFAAAEQAITRSIEVATTLNAPFWQTVGRFLEGKLMVERRDFVQGAEALRDAFESCRRTGWRVSYPEFRGALAAALAGLGQLEEALDVVNDAAASAVERTGSVWYLPELLRIKGEVLNRQAGDRFAPAGEDCFKQAAEMAREHGALFWELRVALSLARMRLTQDRRDEARQTLSSVYGRFTEGFETIDMREAKALLDALTP